MQMNAYVKAKINAIFFVYDQITGTISINELVLYFYSFFFKLIPYISLDQKCSPVFISSANLFCCFCSSSQFNSNMSWEVPTMMHCQGLGLFISGWRNII